MQDDMGMVQRGLFLFALLGSIAAVTLFAVFYRPETVMKEPPPAEHLLALVGTPAAGFPASVAWGALQQLGDTFPSAPGWQIRYNATRALAHRGSAKLPFDILAEMLDEKQQMRNNIAVRDGKRVMDEASAHIIVIGGLKAVRAWAKHPDAVAAADDRDLQDIARLVERLQHSASPTVQAEATETKLALEKIARS